MTKITTTDLANLQNETTAVSEINANFATIVTAMDNTLSRDGSTPNPMAANLDMNTNRILNLPAPNSSTEPLRVQDLTSIISGNVTINSTLDMTAYSTGTPASNDTLPFGDVDLLEVSKKATITNIVQSVTAPQFLTVDVGSTNDTTISRSSAGVIAVEGVTVPLNSISAVLTTGSVELGNASDTTLSRSSAGILAVEGVTVPLNSTSSVHTASSIELGNASDTTLSRASAGVMAVEGASLYPNIPINSQSAAYGIVLADANTCIYHPSSDNNARTYTLPANGTIALPVGTVITFINEINTVTIAITTDTLTFAGVGTTGSRTLAANGMATAYKVATTKWVISGVGLS